MVFRSWILALAVPVLVSSALAADQVGTITASGPFKLRGVSVPATATQSLPLLNGDEVETGSTTAIVALSDGSRVTVNTSSRLKVERIRDETMLGLEQGAVRFDAAAGSRLMVCALGRPIQIAPPAAGTVSIEGPEKVRAVAEKGSVQVQENGTCGSQPEKPKTGWLTRRKAIVLIGATAGGATAASIAVTRPPSPPPSRSPSRP